MDKRHLEPKPKKPLIGEGSYSKFENKFVDDGTLHTKGVDETSSDRTFRYNTMKESHERNLKRENDIKAYCKKYGKYDQLFFLGKDSYPALFKKRNKLNRLKKRIKARLKVTYGNVRQIWKRNRKRLRGFRKKTK